MNGKNEGKDGQLKKWVYKILIIHNSIQKRKINANCVKF
jgi:hypothetical protein